MSEESANGALGDSAGDLLRERVARLEAEVGALRGEVAVLRGAVPQAPLAVFANLNAGSGRAAVRAAQSERPQVPANESLESQLGTRVLSKIGVVLLLVGVAWFLKWAFDNRWIGPMGRVAAGLLVGAGVILWSERFRRQQLAGFSYALKAVGRRGRRLRRWWE
jgi:uncharacterized membrane protein